jgi:phage/plasmid-associated DNA primase
MRGKVFVVVNEPSSDRDDHSAKLKNLITGKEITINNKYGAQYSIKNKSSISDSLIRAYNHAPNRKEQKE